MLACVWVSSAKGAPFSTDGLHDEAPDAAQTKGTTRYLMAFIAVKLFRVRPGRRGTMINTFVNANTIFIGLPLNIALFGNQALPYFLMYYITNTVSTWTLGVYLMTSDSKEGASKQAQKFNWKKLFPAPLLGFLVALVFLVLRLPVRD